MPEPLTRLEGNEELPVDKLQLNMVQAVRTVPLFASLRERDWEEVANLLNGLCFARDGFLFFEGEEPEFLYVVWMGRVKLVRHSVDGRDVVLDVLGPGRMLGEVAVFEGARYGQTAQAMEEVAVISIARDDFLDLLERHPTLALAVINELGRRLRVSNDLVQSLAIDRVERRIARALIRLAMYNGADTDDGIKIQMRLTRQDLADMTGTTVETAIRVMSRFRKQGLITTQRGRVIIKDSDLLDSVANQS
ncbi:MAG: Crp/Fnr family transcriptional regulator [Chloroflexota bacterium]|nr:Crp/Fnr family transcriptional regulator [Chloroflexota bacterium]